MTDFRAALAQLLKAAEFYTGWDSDDMDAAMAVARAALAAGPEGVPTEEPVADYRALLVELYALVGGKAPNLLNEASGGDARLDMAIDCALATGTPAPVPVAERLPRPRPRPQDLDSQGTCWCFHGTAFTWGLFQFDPTVHTHWLPHWALPTPPTELEAPND